MIKSIVAPGPFAPRMMPPTPVSMSRVTTPLGITVSIIYVAGTGAGAPAAGVLSVCLLLLVQSDRRTANTVLAGECSQKIAAIEKYRTLEFGNVDGVYGQYLTRFGVNLLLTASPSEDNLTLQCMPNENAGIIIPDDAAAGIFSDIVTARY